MREKNVTQVNDLTSGIERVDRIILRCHVHIMYQALLHKQIPRRCVVHASML
jgi:hypothetical protein